MPRTRQGSAVESVELEFTVSGGSASAVAVTFREEYGSPPEVFGVRHYGDDGATFTVTSLTRTGCSIALSGSDLPDGLTRFEAMVHERT